MKSYLLVLSVVLFSVNGVFSQAENNDENLALVTKVNASNTYTFSHEVDYFEAFENRLVSVLNEGGEVVESLSIDNYTCNVVFKDELSVAECEEKLSVLVQTLNFSDFEIE
jgi:hypothetical protein